MPRYTTAWTRTHRTITTNLLHNFGERHYCFAAYSHDIGIVPSLSPQPNP